ncbi:MAG: Holliday junction resolvase RuvX, partial [Deinococcus sp.]|nr:Holliday junction resolvase RuvX [Deinococcus sp.]
MPAGRVLALDVGDKRIGLALSDPDRIIASGLDTLVRTGRQRDVAQLAALVAQHQCTLVVVGLPLGLHGRDTAQTQKVRRFVAELAPALPCPVTTSDERLSTVLAERRLKELRAKVKAGSDQAAAVVILEGFLARERREDPA